MRKTSFPITLELERAQDSIVAITTHIPENSYSADLLGTERGGHGIVIDEGGLILTVGYILTEAESVWITLPDQEIIPGYIIGNDHESGLGLVRPQVPIDQPFVRTGSVGELSVTDRLLVAGHAGYSKETSVIALKEFAGRWEFILEKAIYTSPAHPEWTGAALFGSDARLYGIGCLLIQGNEHGESIDGYNMFIPVDAILPHINDIIRTGGRKSGPRPWLGLLIQREDEELVITGIFTGCPADKAGLKPGDIITAIAGKPVTQLSEFFRSVWSLGQTGIEVPVSYTRDSVPGDTVVISGDRETCLIQGPLN